MCFPLGRHYARRSLSLKAPSVVGAGVAFSTVVFIAAVGPASVGGLKGFQGVDGQRKELSVEGSASGVTPGEADGPETVVSSSEDSSLTVDLLGDGGVGSTFLRGLQPGGRRLLSNIWGRKYDMRMQPSSIKAESTQQLSAGHQSVVSISPLFLMLCKIVLTSLLSF